MIDTQLETINRIRAARALRRTAKLNRQINTTIEIGLSAICLLLLGGFVLNLLNWQTNTDLLTGLIHGAAEIFSLPFRPLFGYSTLTFKGGVFSPIYLIAAAIYILAGLTISWVARRVVR